MDSAVNASYETCRRLHRRHDPTYYWATRRLPARHPARDARALRLRAHGRRDRRRPAPRRHARGAAAPSWTRGRPSSTAAWRRATPRIRSSARSWTPAGATALPLGELHAYMGSMRLDCAPGSHADLGGAVRLHGRLGRHGRADHGAAARASRSAITPTTGASGWRSSSTNFLRDLREDYELDRVYLPLEDRERFGVAEADLAGARSSGELRALVAFEVAPGAGAVRGRRRTRSRRRRARRAPACGWPAPPTSACSTASSAIDVLGRRAGLRAWMLPGVVARALHR